MFIFNMGTLFFESAIHTWMDASPYGTNDYTVVTHISHINVHVHQNKIAILQANKI